MSEDSSSKSNIGTKLPHGQDTSSPYFLSSSDNPGNVLVSCLLNGDNYPTWYRAMINALQAKSKLSFLDGTTPKPTSGPDVDAWIKCNSMVISWLFSSLKPELHDSVAYLETAREMWLDLEERVSQGNAPRIHELKRELSNADQKTQSVTVYFTRLKGLWDEWNTYST